MAAMTPNAQTLVLRPLTLLLHPPYRTQQSFMAAKTAALESGSRLPMSLPTISLDGPYGAPAQVYTGKCAGLRYGTNFHDTCRHDRQPWLVQASLTAMTRPRRSMPSTALSPLAMTMPCPSMTIRLRPPPPALSHTHTQAHVRTHTHTHTHND